MKNKKPTYAGRSNRRGDRIRTCDILLPKQARYQAALHPDAHIAETIRSTSDYITQNNIKKQLRHAKISNLNKRFQHPSAYNALE